jgi:branched-chain amino acid transport system substrate-binding protein
MRKILVAAASVLAMSFAGAAAQAEDTLKIGLQSAMTGWGAAWGVPLRATSEMYVDEINEQGGLEVGGKKYMIELFVDDHKADTKLAKAGLERFIHQEGIKILMIHFDNGPDAWLGLPDDVREGLIHVSPVWRPDVFSPPHNGFGTLNLPPNFAPVLFGRVLEDNPDLKTVVELSPRGQFPEMAVQNDKAAVQALGLEWLGVEYFDPDLADPLPVVTKVLALNPDMLNLGCVGQTGPQLLKLARQLGYKGVMSCSCEDDINLYLNHAGPEAAEGFYIIGSHGFPEGPELVAFREKYTEREGEWTAVALAFYQGIRVLIAGIQKAGSIDDIPAIVEGVRQSTVVQELLPGKPVITWGGAETWGQPHQMQVPVVLNTIKDGKATTVSVVPPTVP